MVFGEVVCGLSGRHAQCWLSEGEVPEVSLTWMYTWTCSVAGRSAPPVAQSRPGVCLGALAVLFLRVGPLLVLLEEVPGHVLVEESVDLPVVRWPGLLTARMDM